MEESARITREINDDPVESQKLREALADAPNARRRRRATSRPPICTVDGCKRSVLARGWCSMHYQRWVRHGDVLASRPYRFSSASLTDAFGRSCPVCPGGGVTVAYDTTDGRVTSLRCLSLDHQGDRVFVR